MPPFYCPWHYGALQILHFYKLKVCGTQHRPSLPVPFSSNISCVSPSHLLGTLTLFRTFSLSSYLSRRSVTHWKPQGWSAFCTNIFKLRCVCCFVRRDAKALLTDYSLVSTYRHWGNQKIQETSLL